MNLKNLMEIQALVEARYEIRRQAFQILVNKENGLRSEIKRLNEQAHAAHHQNDAEMQSIGADVIWKAWLGKAKSTLNVKLALVLAEKEQHIRQVRQAYGKVVAAETLTKEFVTDQSKKSRNNALNEAIESSVFSCRVGTGR